MNTRLITSALVGVLSVATFSGLSGFSGPTSRTTAYQIAQVKDGAEAVVAAALTSAGASGVQILDAQDLVTFRADGRSAAVASRHHAVRGVTPDRPITVADRDGDEDDDRNGRDDSPGAAVVRDGRAGSNDEDGDHDDEDGGRRGGRSSGVTVAVLDTGIADHPDLRGRVIARVDLVSDGARSLDPAGHGTHVAGLIAGARRSPKIGGVAPDARLIDVRVLDANGTGTVRAALAAFEWVLRNRARYDIKVVNTSWGAPAVASYHEDPLAAGVEALWLAGILVVVAAGNDGPSVGTVASPGTDPFVLTVGSLEDQGTLTRADDVASSFSALGPTVDGVAKPDVLAPGRKLVSLRSRGSTMERGRPDRIVSESYMRMSGTSAAAALAAGSAAEVIAQNPGYGPDDVKGALMAGARVSGSYAPAVDLRRALRTRAEANAGLAPSRLLLDLIPSSAIPSDVSVEGITWENITWENVTWENITWENITWENVTWENITWESARRDGTPD